MGKVEIKQEWIDKYGEKNIRRVSVEGKEMVFHLPEVHEKPRNVFARALRFYRNDNVLDAGQVIINECWLDGDEEFKNTESMVAISASIEIVNQLGFFKVDISGISKK